MTKLGIRIGSKAPKIKLGRKGKDINIGGKLNFKGTQIKLDKSQKKRIKSKKSYLA